LQRLAWCPRVGVGGSLSDRCAEGVLFESSMARLVAVDRCLTAAQRACSSKIVDGASFLFAVEASLARCVVLRSVGTKGSLHRRFSKSTPSAPLPVRSADPLVVCLGSQLALARLVGPGALPRPSTAPCVRTRTRSRRRARARARARTRTRTRTRTRARLMRSSARVRCGACAYASGREARAVWRVRVRLRPGGAGDVRVLEPRSPARRLLRRAAMVAQVRGALVACGARGGSAVSEAAVPARLPEGRREAWAAA
jgi:hypothetical protein